MTPWSRYQWTDTPRVANPTYSPVSTYRVRSHLDMIGSSCTRAEGRKENKVSKKESARVSVALAGGCAAKAMATRQRREP